MVQTAKTFRVFVSSTFSDLIELRNALQREVFPRLRALCHEHGCRFQAIDLRWGVREEAALDQRAVPICIEEIECCDKTLAIDPRDGSIWNNKGVSLDSLGRYDEAIACYDKALEIDPRFTDAWSNKGSNLNTSARYDEAIACFDKALEIDPRHANAWGNKGVTLLRLGRNDEAIACFDKALAIDPQHALAQKGKQLALAQRR